MNHWYLDVDWQLVGLLALVWVACGMLWLISRLKPRRNRPVKLKSRYWE